MSSIGPLWIRRLLFEHSVAVPLLTTATASALDFRALAHELLLSPPPSSPPPFPSTSYDAWVAAAGLHARLDSSHHAGIIIEALETNAPDAFVRANDPSLLAPGKQVHYRNLSIPIPELLAFIKLHAAATLAARFRETADIIWPETQATPASPGKSPGTSVNTHSLSPASPRVSRTDRDGKSWKKGRTGNLSAILASVQGAFQRETKLVVNNLKDILLIIAAAYGVEPEKRDNKDDLNSDSPTVMGGGGAGVAERGSLGGGAATGELKRTNSMGSANVDAEYAVKNLPIRRDMFEHLSFLLTTTCEEDSGAYRSISSIVPQWRDPNSQAVVPLGELVEIVTVALTRVTLERQITGSTDVAEIRDLERKTFLREDIPNTNAKITGYPHAKEMRISNCTDCHFYLLQALGRVSVVACRDCTLFVGACVSVSLINCANMRVHAIARVCRMTNCFDTHIYLCTNRFPQIVGENRGLIFAPYNAAYGREEVEKYLAAVGVDPKENVWDKFYRPAYKSLSPVDKNDPDLTSAVASVLPPDQFLPFAIPVPSQKSINHSNGKDGKDKQAVLQDLQERDASSRALFSVPLPLPPAYEEQLKKKCAEIANIRREIRALEKKNAILGLGVQQMDITVDDQDEAASKDVAMSDGSGSPTKSEDDHQAPNVQIRKGVVQSLVQERFREWLNHSGRIRQINDLVRLDQDT